MHSLIGHRKRAAVTICNKRPRFAPHCVHVHVEARSGLASNLPIQCSLQSVVFRDTYAHKFKPSLLEIQCTLGSYVGARFSLDCTYRT